MDKDIFYGSSPLQLFVIIYYLFYYKKREFRYAQNSILSDKSLHFAARIAKLNKYFTKEKKDAIISKQIIRSAISVDANANEAIYGQSKADFISKLQISLKETAATEYWLRLLILSEYITETEGEALLED